MVETILARVRRFTHITSTVESDADVNFCIADAEQWWKEATENSTFTAGDDVTDDLIVSFRAAGDLIEYHSNPALKYMSIDKVRMSMVEANNKFHKKAESLLEAKAIADGNVYLRIDFQDSDSKWDENISPETVHVLPDNVV